MGVKKILRKIAKFILSSSSDKKVSIAIESVNYNDILKNRNIVITGGGSGIGKAMAKKFSSEGANVIIIGRNEEKLKKTVNNSRNMSYIVYDVCDIENYNELFNDIEKKLNYQYIDTLICNAGISLHEKDYRNVTVDSFDRQFETNFKSTYFLSKIFIEYLYSKNIKNGNLLIISSETGDQCYDIPYGLTKSALNSYVKALSRRVYKDGIRVNAISPGVTATDMTSEYADISDGNYYRDCASERVFLPEEIAEVACFLISNASNCISGEIIHTNAGNHLNPYWE